MLILHEYCTSPASQVARSVAFGLLVLNLHLHALVSLVAGWAINHGIDETSASGFAVLPVQLFPMMYPTGNPATPFLMAFSIVAGVAGAAASVSGLRAISGWDVPHLSAAAAASVMAWSLDFLAAGLACKEISLVGRRAASLRTLEALTIILSITQLLCTGVIHASLTIVSNLMSSAQGRASLS